MTTPNIEKQRAEVARLIANADRCAQSATELRATIEALRPAIGRAYANGDTRRAAELERELAESEARMPHLRTGERVAREDAARLDKDVARAELPDFNGKVAERADAFARTLRQLHADAHALHRARAAAVSVKARCDFDHKGPDHPMHPTRFINLDGYAFRLYTDLVSISEPPSA